MVQASIKAGQARRRMVNKPSNSEAVGLQKALKQRSGRASKKPSNGEAVGA
jgi:hypothetical protein